MLTSLGAILKNYRIKKKVSQLEIANYLGWKDTSQLSRIEQGKTSKPDRKVIDKIAISLSLTIEEKNLLLLSGNYLPTKSEIKAISIELNNIIENWKYPVTVYDFSWRILLENTKCKIIYYSSDKEAEKIAKYNPNGLEVIFDSDYSQIRQADKSSYQKLYTERLSIIRQYKYSQKDRKNDIEYQKTIAKLLSNREFAKAWNEVNINDFNPGITNYSYAEEVIPARDPNSKVCFHCFIIPMVTDPRISLEFQIPADAFTFEYFEKLNAKLEKEAKSKK